MQEIKNNNVLLEELKKYAVENNVPIIREETLKHLLVELRKIVEKKEKDGRKIRILEIGTAIGYSSINMALLSENIEIYTIEKNIESYNIAKSNIEKLSLNSRIKIYNGDAMKILEDENIQKNKFDFIFIDANKSKYLEYFKITEKLINNEGIIFTDNVLFMGYVLGEYTERKHRTIVTNLRMFLKEILDENKYKSKLYQVEDGYTITRF